MKFHLSLNVADINRSVDFYGKVFGPPSKHRADYAKFETDDPPLVLSLEPTPPTGRGSLNHVGLRLPDSAALVELQRRLELVGLRSEREEGVECCYAKQTKFWLHSPDGVLWEFYVHQGDIGHRGAGQVPETIDAVGHAPQSPPATSPPTDDLPIWEHRLTEPFPETLEVADASLAEIHLLGTFNTNEAEARRDEILTEASRALAPGGRLALHLLTADRPLPDSLSLPGPAAAVKAVPSDADLLASLEQTGFVGARLTRFGPTPCFRIGGAELRETMIEAFVPAADDCGSVVVVYRGPFREVVDDTGRVFRRGERVRMPLTAWERLSASLPVDAFTRLTEPETTPIVCGLT